MLADFLLNLAAGLTQTLLEAGATRLRRAALGSDEDRALRTALQQGFVALLSDADTQMPPATLRQDSLNLVTDIFAEFVMQPEVANNLLAMALAGVPPDLPLLALAFDALDFERTTLAIDFTQSLTAFHEGLTHALMKSAQQNGSPLYNQVSLGRILAIQALLQDQQRSLVQIVQAIARIEQTSPQTVYNIIIERNLGSLDIGDNAQVEAKALPEDVQALLTYTLAMAPTVNRIYGYLRPAWDGDETEVRYYPVKESGITIGRDPQICTLVVPWDFKRTSRVHASVFPNAGAIYIMDMGSKNGTYVDGNRVTDIIRLNPGQHILLGAGDRTDPLCVLEFVQIPSTTV